MKPWIFAICIALAVLLGIAVHPHIWPCPEIDIRATEDSIAARVPFYIEQEIRREARMHILDSIDSLPTPQQREPFILDHVRSLDLERQLERAEQDPR